MSFIILGDPHIGKSQAIGKPGIGANLNSRVADQIDLLDWTLEQAVDNNTKNIIITGDVFEDAKPHPTLIAIFISWLKKCQDYGVHVHIIMGNHDLIRSGTILVSSLDIISEMELNNVSVYKDIHTIFIGTTAITMVPFRDRKYFGTSSCEEALNILSENFVYELASIPVTYKKVLIGHLAIAGSIPVGDEIDDLTNELFCSDTMFAGYDYVWMGHVHNPQVMKKNNPYIAHIGSMDISNFGETNSKKILIYFNCDAENLNNMWSSIPLPTRTLKKINISIPKDTKDSTKFILEELEKISNLKNSMVKVEISLEDNNLKNINKLDIDNYLSSQGVFNIVGITESKKSTLIKKDSNNTLDTKMDMPSAIKKYAETYIEEKKRSQFIELSMKICSKYNQESKE